MITFFQEPLENNNLVANLSPKDQYRKAQTESSVTPQSPSESSLACNQIGGRLDPGVPQPSLIITSCISLNSDASLRALEKKSHCSLAKLGHRG